MMKRQTIARPLGLVAVVLASLAATGCASIISGTNQIVSVETTYATSPLAGATCKLENDKGVYYVTTPGTVTVHRAYGDMNVKCEKAGIASGVATIKSSTKGMMAGNILLGGVIGAGVDTATGAGFDYPFLMQVVMSDPPTETVAVSAVPVMTSVQGRITTY
jgi:hypothetical protein